MRLEAISFLMFSSFVCKNVQISEKIIQNALYDFKKVYKDQLYNL